MGELNDAEKVLAAGLWALPGAGARSLERILERFTDVGQLVELPFERWLPEIELPFQAGDVLAAARAADVRSAAESARRLFADCRKHRTEIAWRGDPAYPPLLAAVDAAPPLLFLRGPGAREGDRRRVAMVGTRKPDASGAAAARYVAGTLARSDITIVSGAARGIDTLCHEAALAERGETWAFLGSAIDEADPHPRAVMERILPRRGTVFSELPPGVRADRNTFPRRNRLISGASELVIVVRAPLGSGALITAADAKKQGRPVMAVPGDMDNKIAWGCNQLLFQGEAQPCWGPLTAVRALGLPDSALVSAPPERSAPARSPRDETEARIVAALAGKAIDFDALQAACGLGSGELAAALTTLELDEVVRSVPGRRYCLA